MGSVSLKIGDGTARFRSTIILREIEASERRLHQIKCDLAGYETLDPAKPGLPPELKLVRARHPLPLGRDSRSGITIMAIRTGWVHPNINLDNPEENVDASKLVGLKKERLDVKVALSNSFGFGGHNSSVLFAPYK